MKRALIRPAKSSGLPDLELDVTVSISYTLPAQIVRHPVESGPTITDEVNLEPETVEVSALLLDIDPKTFSQGDSWRAEQLLEQLKRFRRQKVLLTLLQPDSPPISRLLIGSINVTREVSTGSHRPTSISLERVDIAELSLVETVLDSDLQALGELTSIDMGLQP